MAHESIAAEIAKLKKKHNAVILAHNYQLPEVQDIADYTGDSLGLAMKAAETDADVIVFCGVMFMAETAKILSPEKKVIIPEPDAVCPLAAMITPETVRKLKKDNPGVPVIAYVNTTAAVKAEADYCCTSSNLLKVADHVKSRKIIFIPDRHMAAYLQIESGKTVITGNGYCPTHAKILPEHIMKQKKKHPKAMVLAHPECVYEVLELADIITSTGGMQKYAKSLDAREFIVATENGLLYGLKKDNPGKKFYPASESALCPNMKKTDMGKVLESLKTLEYEVKLPDDIIRKAKLPIKRMMEIS